MNRARTQTEHQLRIEDFMRKALQLIPPQPTMPDEEVRRLRANLILEEALETITALGFNLEVHYPQYHGTKETGLPVTKSVCRLLTNEFKELSLVEIADGCADVSVVTIGTLSACGIADEPILSAVDQSNLAKFSGDGHKDAMTGKWIKPTDWQPPDLEGVLNAQTKDYVGGNGR